MANELRSVEQRVEGVERRLIQTLRLRDLIPLSVSSVGPLFSVAATGGVMAAQAGWWTLPVIFLLAIPFIITSFVFRLLNRHFPNAGASYHWSGRVIGRGTSRYQAWILIVAYFLSIPPIAIPAGTYTVALLFPHAHAAPLLDLAVSLVWIVLAAIPLALGSRPTAVVTQIFFVVEMVALFGLGALGVARWHAISVPIHFGHFPFQGALIVMVVAATILDGWEINSYAAEESTNPTEDPGTGGIIGALGALLFYAILYPLMLGETPLHLLANSTDPLAEWSHRLLPGAPWVTLLPVLLSTAGGLWLTSFILTRALYAMGRERVVPQAFGTLSKRHVPTFAIVFSLGLVAIVITVETLVTSLSGFFTLVLSGAGFFLVAEFFLDCVTAIVFLTRGHRRLPDVTIAPHDHRGLLIGAAGSAVFLGALMVLFFIYGPTAIGNGVDQVIAGLIGLGVAFAYWSYRRTRNLPDAVVEPLTTGV